MSKLGTAPCHLSVGTYQCQETRNYAGSLLDRSLITSHTTLKTIRVDLNLKKMTQFKTIQSEKPI
jgi:hypothetical protein